MTEEVKAAQLVAEQAAYDRMKLELQLWTIATSLICCGATWAFYSQVISVAELDSHPLVFCTREAPSDVTIVA